MAGTATLSEANREALALVRRHRLWTFRILGVAWLAAVLGLCSCLFGMPASPILIGVELGCFLLGTAVGCLMLLRLWTYGRPIRLIAAAQQLDLRFTFPRREPSWETLAQQSDHWPQIQGEKYDILLSTYHPVPAAVAGLLVGERDGISVALLEPANTGSARLMSIPPSDFVVPRYVRTYRHVFALLLDVLPAKRESLELPPNLAAEAKSNDLTVEVRERSLIVARKADLADVEKCSLLLSYALRVGKHFRT